MEFKEWKRLQIIYEVSEVLKVKFHYNPAAGFVYQSRHV